MAVLAPLVLLDLDVYSVASRKSTSTTTTDTELATDSQKMERFPKTSQTDRCLWSVLPLSSGVAESGVWRLEVGDRENACKATKLHQHRLGTLAAIKKTTAFPGTGCTVTPSRQALYCLPTLTIIRLDSSDRIHWLCLNYVAYTMFTVSLVSVFLLVHL